MRRRKKKKQSVKEISIKKPPTPRLWDKRAIFGLVAVLLLCLSVSLPGIGWARNGSALWYQDVIEGLSVVREMPRMFGEWTYKYPRAQYAIDSAFYKMMILKWEKDPVQYTDANGVKRSTLLSWDRLDKLAMISRTTSLLMGLGAVAAVYFCCMFWFGDWLSAILGASCLTLTQTFVFHNHISSVDIPCMFWFAWGIYWVLKSVKTGRWYHYLLMGVTFALSICTKEAVVGFLVGVVPAFWLAMIGRCRQEGKTYKSSIASVFSLKVLLAVSSFLFTYAFIQGILISPQAYIKRMTFWRDATVTDVNPDFLGHWWLFKATCADLYVTFGWPLLALIIVSVVWFSIKYRWWSGLVTLPLLSFYLVVTINIEMVRVRHFIPAYAGLAICTGCFCSWLIANKKIPRLLRYIPLCAVFLLSLFYCIALDLEMVNDSRIKTEKWFAENARPGSSIACVVKSKQLAPRLGNGKFQYNPQWSPVPVGFARANLDKMPDYIILTRKWHSTKDANSKAFWQAIVDGELGFTRIARYNPKYLWPRKHFLGIAGWPESSVGKMDVPMMIYKKDSVK